MSPQPLVLNETNRDTTYAEHVGDLIVREIAFRK
jgi:hypothetical protein